MLIKRAYAFFLFSIKKIFGLDFAKKLDTAFRFHKKLSLKNPQTLADKIAYIENHCQAEKASMCTDKWDVRSYVREKNLEDILVPTYGGVFESFEEIPFDEFPQKFVLKATHGCKMNFVCTNKETLDIESCKKQVNTWLKTTYGPYSCEWHYLNIPRRIYCEKYLSFPRNLIDYKIHCINGIPAFILTCSDREIENNGRMSVKLGLYDTEWNKIEGVCAYKSDIPSEKILPRPKQLDRMLEIAQILSEEFKFVRIDLYDIDDKILFGEMTFTPAACVFPYFTEEFLLEYGKKLTL